MDLLYKLDVPALSSPLPTPPSPPQYLSTRSQVTTPQWPESTQTEEVKQATDIAPPPRPGSTRTTGLRSRLNSCQVKEESNKCLSVSRGESRSGRVSQLRGELQGVLKSSSSEIFLPSLENDDIIRSSASNPCLSFSDKESIVEENTSDKTLFGSFLEDACTSGSNVSPIRPPRVKTATLAKGRRQMPVVDQSFKALSEIESLHNEDTSSATQFPPPILSNKDPVEMSLETDSWKTRSECLDSISKFDRSHLGQIKPDMQGKH